MKKRNLNHSFTEGFFKGIVSRKMIILHLLAHHKCKFILQTIFEKILSIPRYLYTKFVVIPSTTKSNYETSVKHRWNITFNKKLESYCSRGCCNWMQNLMISIWSFFNTLFKLWDHINMRIKLSKFQSSDSMPLLNEKAIKITLLHSQLHNFFKSKVVHTTSAGQTL